MGKVLKTAGVCFAVISPLLAGSAPAHGYTFNEYGFRKGSCTYSLSLRAESLVWAKATTYDKNSGCRYIDADLKYKNVWPSPATFVTQYCTEVIASSVTCQRYTNGDNRLIVSMTGGRGRAQETSTRMWGSSDWIAHP
jgi:hypothetical protein